MTNYELDKDNSLWVKGWGVFRNNPWHFDQLFPTKSEAEARRNQLGQTYVVEFGSRRLATDDFVVSSPTE